MLKRMVLLLAAAVLCLAVCLPALAGEWVCPDCGRTNQGNFCPDCGAKSPGWICPACGFENAGRFCEDCGAAKPENELAAAFSGQASLRLVPSWPAGLAPDTAADESLVRILSLSPDGKTILGLIAETQIIGTDVQTVTAAVHAHLPGRTPYSIGSTAPLETTNTFYRFCLIREGKIIPVGERWEKGSGDPYGHLENLITQLRYIPGAEGFSWSGDGRYITFSDTRNLSQYNFSDWKTTGVPVIDTSSGELWLADSYVGNNLFRPEFGCVLLSRMSRDGKYVYYLVLRNLDDELLYCFCRCTPDGLDREILCRIQNTNDELRPFSLISSSDMYERPDGSWMMLATTEAKMEHKKASDDAAVIVSFRPSGDSWQADIHSTGIPAAMNPIGFAWSPVSGRGLILFEYGEERSLYVSLPDGDPDDGSREEERALARRLHVAAIRPEADHPFAVWYMHRTGAAPDEAEMLSGDLYFDWLRARNSGQNPEKPADLVPDSSQTPEPLSRTFPLIFRACISPDGRCALAAALLGDWNESTYDRTLSFYLIDLETMAVVPAEAPAGFETVLPSRVPLYSSGLRTDMFWLPDGTVFIPGNKGDNLFFRLASFPSGTGK